ncbi:MAG: carbohydrate ABC transporter permease [Candidatus Kapabacteria bacterium]|nr:carbohydrate ABC transporter permease [Candidatus Kapabacteria bacterium]MCS7169366.1 carbohydrate ABC transporter permease [Candidatus Kapabacteria bacterium]MDW7997281.1 carbohydrate ABC transporter permease [Bacteroidota bacterium]
MHTSSTLLHKLALYGVLLLVALIMLLPMAWMLLLSLRHYPEQYATVWELLSAPSTLENYALLLRTTNFAQYALNSLIVAGSITAGNVLFGFMAGYALARYRFPGKPIIEASVLVVLLIPMHVLMLPLYRMMASLGLIDTYWALILPWLVGGLSVFMIRQYLLALPTELEDAARLDGARPWTVLFRIVLPLARPALLMVGLTSFLTHWNSFLFPFLLTQSDARRTLPVGLAFYISRQTVDWGHLMAGAAVAALPAILLFLLFRRTFLRGILSGALRE